MRPESYSIPPPLIVPCFQCLSTGLGRDKVGSCQILVCRSLPRRCFQIISKFQFFLCRCQRKMYFLTMNGCPPGTSWFRSTFLSTRVLLSHQKRVCDEDWNVDDTAPLQLWYDGEVGKYNYARQASTRLMVANPITFFWGERSQTAPKY